MDRSVLRRPTSGLRASHQDRVGRRAVCSLARRRASPTDHLMLYGCANIPSERTEQPVRRATDSLLADQNWRLGGYLVEAFLGAETQSASTLPASSEPTPSRPGEPLAPPPPLRLPILASGRQAEDHKQPEPGPAPEDLNGPAGACEIIAAWVPGRDRRSVRYQPGRDGRATGLARTYRRSGSPATMTTAHRPRSPATQKLTLLPATRHDRSA
jgi:hypothetical protein